MISHEKITGKYYDGRQLQNCFGKVEILSINGEHKTAYASWQIFDEQRVKIADVTKNYFFGEIGNPQEEIIKMILIDIQKYRMNRQKVFSEFEVNE